MKRRIVLKLLALFPVVLVILLGCGEPTQTTPPTYTLPQLEYLLLAYFDDFFWCDPYQWPIGRPEQEQIDALEQFPSIRANEAEFMAILEYLSLSYKDDYTDEEKLLIFRQHNKLAYAVETVASGDVYRFTLRVGEGQGWRYEGTITLIGHITVQKQEVSFNTCPVCLAQGTLIGTPFGPVPVDQLRKGMAVWTVRDSGQRIAVAVAETAVTPVPSNFMLARLGLSDGLAVVASPGHPSADGRVLGDYRVGDILDRALVVAVEYIAYEGSATYDILPAGTTGLYWANGVLLRSTLWSN